MKTFKKFFEDDQLGDIDIYAKEPRKKFEPLGQVTEPGKDKITKYIGKVSQRGDEMIEDLITDSGFDTIQYHRSMRAILDEHEINWQAFQKHVATRFKKGIKLTHYFKGTNGEVDFVRVFKPVTDSLLVNPQVDGDAFFEELFTLNHAIGNTAVGDGEFLLGIVGNGVKGIDGGDVDVLRLVKKGKTALEVGTWSKIIGDSSREKGRKGVALKLRNLVLQNQPGAWQEEAHASFGELISTFKTLTSADKEYVFSLLEAHSGTDTGPYLPINRIIGSVVLYDYIIGHGDNFIAVINYSGGASGQKKMAVKARTSLGIYKARFCNPKKLGLEGTINLSLEDNYFGFSIDKSAVRIQLGV